MTEQLTEDEIVQTCFQQDSVTTPMSHAWKKPSRNRVPSDTFSDRHHTILLSLIFLCGIQWIIQSAKKMLLVSIIWKKQSLILLEVPPTLKSHTSALAS